MKKNKYICPYCGAPALFEQPYSRWYQFLFWTIKLRSPWWYVACSEYCQDFILSDRPLRGRTLAECRRNWLAWYEAETAGLPDIPILDYAKYRKDLNRGK